MPDRFRPPTPGEDQRNWSHYDEEMPEKDRQTLLGAMESFEALIARARERFARRVRGIIDLPPEPEPLSFLPQKNGWYWRPGEVYEQAGWLVRVLELMRRKV